MNRREFIGGLGGAAAAWPLAARAQQAAAELIAHPRIAFLGAESASTNQHFFDAFRQGMREHGYIDGRNVTFLERWAEGRSERFPELIGELLSLKPNVILAVSSPAAVAAKNGTTTIPIVFIAADPLGSGLVSGLARPAGNLTGFSLFLGDEFSSKWLELLKEAIPSISRVAALWNPVNPVNANYVSVLRGAAEKLGIVLQPQRISDPDEFASVFGTIVAERAQALVVVIDPLTVRYRERIVEFAMKNRLPAMYGFREFVEAGGLIAYGVNVPALCRRAAIYVDKIIKGANPADLPVEQPTTFELVINLKTAKALGLTIAADAARPRRRGHRIDRALLRCMSPVLALSGHHDRAERCPLSGGKRTFGSASAMSANDPKRTSGNVPITAFCTSSPALLGAPYLRYHSATAERGPELGRGPHEASRVHQTDCWLDVCLAGCGARAAAGENLSHRLSCQRPHYPKTASRPSLRRWIARKRIYRKQEHPHRVALC
jgi:putative ABC transport system substrate-binding protein